MKKLIVLFFSITIILLFSEKYSDNVYAAESKTVTDETNEEKLLKKSKRQQSMINGLLDMYAQEGFDKETILGDNNKDEMGFFYFDNDGETVIIQKPKENKLANGDSAKKATFSKKIDKLEKVASDFQNKFGKDKLKFKEVDYTYSDLEKILNQLVEDENNLKIKGRYSILVDKEKIELRTPNITDKEKTYLQNKYGNALVINVDPNYKSATTLKTRRSDWSKLGGGLGIQSRDKYGNPFTCSTGGVVYKGSTYWVLTAGHCTDASVSPFLQFGATLGTRNADFNAFGGGLDVGLIYPNNSPFTRYAYNGVLVGTRDADISDFSRNMTSAKSYTTLNELVCKSGITTGYTCGRVTQVTVKEDGFTYTEATKDIADGYFAGEGDSGGSVTTSNDTFVGLVAAGDVAGMLPTGEYVAYNLLFTRWGDFSTKYGLYFYTSSSQKPM